MTSVPSGVPAPGWTTRPGRLVDHDDVARRRGRSAPPPPASAAGGARGRARRRRRARSPGPRARAACRPSRRAPSSVHRAAARAAAAASARLTSRSMATRRSSRSPSSAAGTGSLTVGGPSARPQAAGSRPFRQAATTSSRPPIDDGGVGHVEDGPPLQVDEVDDLALQEAAVARGTGGRARLPAAPPTTRPMATAPSVERAPARPRPPAPPRRRGRSTPMTGPKPRPWLNAIPLLNVRLKRSVQKTSIGPSGGLSRSRAHHFVSWSSGDDDGRHAPG